MLQTIVHVLGGTCVGKSTIIDAMIEKYGERVAAVSVGKALRAKYLDPKSPHFNPDKFRGRGSPEEMESEALEMHKRLVQYALGTDAEIILVDGQPRTAHQAKIIGAAGMGVHQIDNLRPQATQAQRLVLATGEASAPSEPLPPITVRFRQRYLYVHASDAIRRERLGLRFGANDGIVSDPEKRIGYELGLERIVNDDRDNLEVLIELGKLATSIAYVDTSSCPAGDAGKEKLASFVPAMYELFSTEPE